MRPSNEKHFHEHHEYGEQKDEHGNKSRGYAQKEYEHQEFPKVIDQDADGKDVVVDNQEAADRYFAQQAEAEKESV